MLTLTTCARSYYALIAGKPGSYGVVLPDLAGCCAAGSTIDQALSSAQAAAADWLTAAAKKGWPAPQARDEATLLEDPEVRQSIREGASLLMVDLPPPVAPKRNSKTP